MGAVKRSIETESTFGESGNQNERLSQSTRAKNLNLLLNIIVVKRNELCINSLCAILQRGALALFACVHTCVVWQ